MPRLEYRLFDEQRGFPLLVEYNFIDKDEVSLRFACDYFVKDGVVYEKTSCAIEPRTYVIYVTVAEGEQASANRTDMPDLRGGIRIELREYSESASYYPVVHLFRFQDDDDALLYLQSDYLEWNGVEWAKTSAEVDEDRKVYVYYAKPAS